MNEARTSLAVWKFSSCDGCQLAPLDCEEDLLRLARRFEIAYFLEASRATRPGPYDISLVEGSIATSEDAERIRRIRGESRSLVSIGACAISGGIQGLRNDRDFAALAGSVYPHPQHLTVAANSEPIAAHVKVDYELRGCPIDRAQLLETIVALAEHRRPAIPTVSVCAECKAAQTVCVAVAGDAPCFGPVTHAGCGALCPRYGRGCYGCFGLQEAPNLPSMSAQLLARGVAPQDLAAVYASFNAAVPALREEARLHERH
jgi:sulfhydrogenase subunit delta